MKKTPVSRCALVLGACLPALLATSVQAQASSVSIYGMLDVGLRRAPNLSVSDKGVTRVDDGARSRIGFRGTEDLGDGLKAFFRLEHSLRMDTGAMRESVFWDDKAWVGLDSKQFGQVMLGRLRSPTDEYTNGTSYEAFMGHTLGASGGRAAASTDAWNNAVYYISPKWQGLAVGAGWSAGESALRSSSGAHLEYKQGPLDLAVAWQRDGETLSSSKGTFTLAGTVQLPGFMLLGTWARTSDIGVADSGRRTTWTLGTRVPVGKGEVRASMRDTDDSQINARNDRSKDVDLRHIGLGYHHPLSKRTSVNTTVSWDRRTAYDASGAVASKRSGPGFEVGLRVSF